jgi:hypothetical protein
MRAQASIWQNTNQDETEKLRQEAELQSSRLAERAAEVRTATPWPMCAHRAWCRDA